MKHVILLLTSILSICSLVAQEQTGPVKDVYTEPWRDFNFAEAQHHEELFGRPPLAPRLHEPNLLRSGKVKPMRGGMLESLIAASPYAASTADDARTVTQLSAPPYQVEGFVAIPDDNVSVPPDCAGAVSPTHVVTVLNSEIRVQDRKGRDLRTLSVARFFAFVGPFITGLYDPRIVWDNNARRWTIIMLADSGTRTPAMLIAVSRTADPLGDWRITRLSPPALGISFDYPIMALSGPFLIVSLNAYKNDIYDSTFNYVFFLRDLYGGSNNAKQFEDFLGNNVPASDPDPAKTKALLTNIAVGIFDANLRVIFKEVRILNSTEIVVGDRIVVQGGDFDPDYLSSILPQQGSEVLIHASDNAIQNCVARGTNVWCVGNIFIRYGSTRTVAVQLYVIDWLPVPAPPTVSRLRIDDTGGQNMYAYPSVAVNKNNDIFIGYNRFRRDQYPSARFAFRRDADPRGAFHFDGLLKEGEDSYTKGSFRVRWGDYSSTVVDPADDTAFWTLQEYAATRTESGASQWGTWWTRFSQRVGQCNFRLDRGNADVPATASILRVGVTTNAADCASLLAPNASWITTVGSATTAGPGTLEFQIGLNRKATARTGTITIGDQTFTINQQANPTPPAQEPILFVTKVEAPLSARPGDSITVFANVRNTGSRGAATFRVAFYLSNKLPVTGRDIFTGFGCVVNQGLLADEQYACTGSFQLPADLTPGTYYLAAIADDREQITITDRSPSVRVSDAGTFLVLAAVNAPAITASGLVNGATAQPGAVAPGMIAVCYGARLGPVSLTTLKLDAQGHVASVLDGTRLLFDGVAAPLIYTSAGQVSAIVPYSVAGKSTVNVIAEYNGVRGASISVPVVAAAPGLFTVDFSGKNQVAALNENGTVNSASNAAERGKLIVFYGTGAGTFRTQPIDGAVIGSPLPEFLNGLSITIGGVEAELLYGGPAPGLVSGVFQINARVPIGLEPSDAVPVVIRSGVGATVLFSPAGAAIAVK